MSSMTKLTEIQSKLKAPKDKKNTFGGYTYRSCESILEALKPLMAQTKTSLTITDEMVCIGERLYVKATATLYDSEKDSRIATTSAYAREAEVKKGMDESQITGSASSYARKYRLNGLFAIDDSKDADTDEYTRLQREEKPRRKQKLEPQPLKPDDVPLQWQNRTCEVCGKPLTPKVAERSFNLFKGHLYCSKDCRAKGSIEDIQNTIETKLKEKGESK